MYVYTLKDGIKFDGEARHRLCLFSYYLNKYSQRFVYCRVFVPLIIDYSTKKGVLVYSRKCASEIVSYMLSNEILRFLSEMEVDITTGVHYSYPTSFGQVPVFVIFVLKYSLLKNFFLLLHL